MGSGALQGDARHRGSQGGSPSGASSDGGVFASAYQVSAPAAASHVFGPSIIAASSTLCISVSARASEIQSPYRLEMHSHHFGYS